MENRGFVQVLLTENCPHFCISPVRKKLKVEKRDIFFFFFLSNFLRTECLILAFYYEQNVLEKYSVIYILPFVFEMNSLVAYIPSIILWLPGITNYFHFSLFRVNRVFSFAGLASVLQIKTNEIKCNTASMNTNPINIFFTVVNRPNSFDVFENYFHLRGYSGNKQKFQWSYMTFLSVTGTSRGKSLYSF